jgi:hypothetical protein
MLTMLSEPDIRITLTSVSVTDRRDRHDVEQADVDIGDVERHLAAEQVDDRTEGNHGVDDQRRHHRDDRCGREHPFVREHRRDVFLQHQLDGIGHWLEDAVRADTHRPEPRLRPRDHLALEQHHVGDRDERRIEHDDDLQQRNEKGIDHQGVTTSNAELAESAEKI